MNRTQYIKFFEIGFILISILMFIILIINYYVNITKYNNTNCEGINFDNRKIAKYQISISNSEFLFFDKQQQTFLINIKLMNQFNSIVELSCITGNLIVKDDKLLKILTDKLVLKFKKKYYYSKVIPLSYIKT